MLEGLSRTTAICSVAKLHLRKLAVLYTSPRLFWGSHRLSQGRTGCQPPDQARQSCSPTVLQKGCDSCRVSCAPGGPGKGTE